MSASNQEADQPSPAGAATRGASAKVRTSLATPLPRSLSSRQKQRELEALLPEISAGRFGCLAIPEGNESGQDEIGDEPTNDADSEIEEVSFDSLFGTDSESRRRTKGSRRKGSDKGQPEPLPRHSHPSPTGGIDGDVASVGMNESSDINGKRGVDDPTGLSPQKKRPSPARDPSPK